MSTIRREKEAEWARTLIIQAAVRAFTQKGYHGATMDEIARNAGYSPAAVYRYFSSKDEIFRAALEAVKEQFSILTKDEPPSSLGFVDRLRWFLGRILQYAAANRDFLVAFIAQRGFFEWDINSELGKAVDRARKEHMEQLGTLMQTGIEQGVLRAGDPQDHAIAFIGITHAFVFRWLINPETRPLEPNIETMLNLFLHGAGIPEGQ